MYKAKNMNGRRNIFTPSWICWAPTGTTHDDHLMHGLYRHAKFGSNQCSSFDNMKLSIFRPFGLKTPIHAPKIGVLGVFHPQNGEQCRRNPQKGTSVGRNGSSDVLITSLSAIVSEKSRGNKKCDGEEEEEEEEEKKRHIFGLFGIAVKWP